MPMLAVVSPISAVPIVWGCGVICIWIPRIWIVVDVRVPIVPIRIIIKVARRSVVSVRKSKTEALSPGNQDSRLSLRIRTLGWNQGQSAYRHCD